MTDQPVGEIIKGITDDVKLLVRDEIALAKAELIPAAKNGGIGAGLFAGAGYFAISALFVLYFAAAFGLATAFGWSNWLGFLVVGIALFVIAAICGGVGFMLVRKVKGPERAIAQANQTVTEVKTAAQQALAAAKAPQIEGEVVRERRALR
jgi:VIT1/CCC1 family predicted Fe2+/Mn2+ transporter